MQHLSNYFVEILVITVGLSIRGAQMVLETRAKNSRGARAPAPSSNYLVEIFVIRSKCQDGSDGPGGLIESRGHKTPCHYFPCLCKIP